jgi:hypothetical protein
VALVVRLTALGLRLTGGPPHAPPAADDFLLATEDGEDLASDAGESLATEPPDAG